MNQRLVIDKAGRIVLPKPVRQQLQLEEGDSLELESSGDQITLRPVRGTGPLVKEQGVWVFYAHQPLSTSAADEVLQQIRKERDAFNQSGK